MTNEQMQDAFVETYNEFWNRYRTRQPKEQSEEWERMHSRAAVLRKKYPFMEELLNRMLTELVERARGRGNRTDDFHMPPG